MLLRCQISFIFCQLFTLFFSFFLVFFYVFQPSRPYSILDILQLYNKESAPYTLCSLSGSASCVVSQVVIQRYISILPDFSFSWSCLLQVFYLGYSWLVDKSSTFIYLQKQNLRPAQVFGNGNFPYSLLLCSGRGRSSISMVI